MRDVHTVIVLDDDTDYLELVGDLLAAEGMVVEGYADAELALARLREGSPPSVVVCDLNMTGFAGLALLGEIRRACARGDGDVRFDAIVVVTGHARLAAMAKSQVCAALTKPIDVDVLLVEVRRCRAGPGGQQRGGGAPDQRTPATDAEPDGSACQSSMALAAQAATRAWSWPWEPPPISHSLRLT